MIGGIDISHHQGDPVYKAVERQGFNFIIHKATEGATYQDQMYHQNRQNMPFTLWGAYHVFRLDSPNDTDAEVDNFLSHALLKPGDLPAFLDLEHKYLEGGPLAEIDIMNILAWTSRVQQATQKWPIIYISPRGLKELAPYDKYLKHLFLWVADHDDDPTDEIPPYFKWLFWQYTSKGPGIPSGFQSQNLCLDHFNGSTQELHLLTSKQ